MSYARYRQHIQIPLVANRTLSQILFSLYVPANRTFTVFKPYVYIVTAGSAGAAIQIQGLGLATGASQGISINYATSLGYTAAAVGGAYQTLPVTLSNTNTTPTVLSVIQLVADTSGVGTMIFDIEIAR